MRVRIDRGAEAVHLALSDAAIAARKDVAEGVAIAYDATGRIVGVAVRGVDPAALHEFTVELSGLADRPAAAPAASPRPAPGVPPPQPPATEGPVGWDAEAEAVVTKLPFFQRGPTRLAAIALARQRGLDRVTAALVAEVRGGRR